MNNLKMAKTILINSRKIKNKNSMPHKTTKCKNNSVKIKKDWEIQYKIKGIWRS